MGKKTGKKKSGAAAQKKLRKREERDLSKGRNKQRTLVFSSRGITHRNRHFMRDIQDLLPHSKKDVKLDAKEKLFVINEVCEMKNCNNCIFFEARKGKDLYAWISKAPHGPSAKFLVQNVHTMSETKLTGNCLKGSRPILSFDSNFDNHPAYSLLKELFTQVFGSPKGHPKVKPFTDHVLSFFILDNRIWFRNYQIIYQTTEGGAPEGEEAGVVGKKQVGEPMLVEIGPRFCLNPIRIFSGSFGGPTLWENPAFVSPNLSRALMKQQKSSRYEDRQGAKDKREEHEKEHQVAETPLDNVFVEEE